MNKLDECLKSPSPGYFVTEEEFRIEKEKLKKVTRDFYYYVDRFFNTISIDKDGYNDNRLKRIVKYVDLNTKEIINFP